MNENDNDFPVPIARVIELYERGIREHGGAHSPPKDGCVERSLGTAVQSAGYASQAADGEPETLTVAAFLLLYLVANHCFADGNKRVAWATFCEYLAYSHVEVAVSEEDAAAFVLRLAEHSGASTADQMPAVVEWIAMNLAPLPLAFGVGAQSVPGAIPLNVERIAPQRPLRLDVGTVALDDGDAEVKPVAVVASVARTEPQSTARDESDIEAR